MKSSIRRRDFLKTAALLPLAGAVSPAQTPAKPAVRSTLKVSLNAYSFNKLMNDASKKRGPGATLVQVTPRHDRLDEVLLRALHPVAGA